MQVQLEQQMVEDGVDEGTVACLHGVHLAWGGGWRSWMLHCCE